MAATAAALDAAFGDADAGLEAELAAMGTDELRQRISMLGNQIRAHKSELNRLDNEIK